MRSITSITSLDEPRFARVYYAMKTLIALAVIALAVSLAPTPPREQARTPVTTTAYTSYTSTASPMNLRYVERVPSNTGESRELGLSLRLLAGRL